MDDIIDDKRVANNSIMKSRRQQLTEMQDFLGRTSCRNEDEYYLDKVQRILSGYPHLGVPQGPTKIAEGIYLGATCDAENFENLRRLGITHVVNCNGPMIPGCKRNPYVPSKSGLRGYVDLMMCEGEDYYIPQHFRFIFNYIKKARLSGGQVLVCGRGVSCSGAIAIGYLLFRGKFLLEAVRTVKDLRWTVLGNVGFMKHLVEYAKDLALLDPEPKKIRTESYGTKRDQYRLMSSNWPNVNLY